MLTCFVGGGGAQVIPRVQATCRPKYEIVCNSVHRYHSRMEATCPFEQTAVCVHHCSAICCGAEEIGTLTRQGIRMQEHAICARKEHGSSAIGLGGKHAFSLLCELC